MVLYDTVREGERERGREGERERGGEREGERERGREREREGEGEREGGERWLWNGIIRYSERGGERERGREGEREGGRRRGGQRDHSPASIPGILVVPNSRSYCAEQRGIPLPTRGGSRSVSILSLSSSSRWQIRPARAIGSVVRSYLMLSYK